ncbi:MAG: bacteriohopanetetrol glucosamine biosynthesis glycosyltransferase HpnI [Verrucomicrobiota bacterium]|jgi:ceramide glucosyltransferase
MNLLNSILAVLALLSFALALWQWVAARRFPLHQRVTDLSFAPGITLLKPLKGCDATTAESLQSWCNQNYAGQIQVLFGVADAGDPVCKIVRELIEKNPGRDAQLVICAESPGANGKVSTLIQLERLAQHPLILVSDADVRVPPDFLANIVAPLRDPQTGLVNCFYRLANPATTAMRCEAVAINADFWSQVLQSTNLKPLDFALGAAMLTRRKLLEEIGGFTALVNCLADDYQLGHRLAQRGHRLALCPVVVECWDAPMNWREVWKHQLRWARTIRVCQPVPYFFSILSNATLWPLLWLMASLVWSKTLCAPLIAVVCLLIRIVLAQNLQRRFMPSRDNIAPPWLVPVKDLQQAAIWAGAFLGNTVEWRGQKMRLRRDGALIAEK